MNVIGQSPEKFSNIDPIFNGEFFTEYVDFILGTSARCLIYYYTAQKYAPDLSLQQVARLNSNIFFCTFRPGSSDKFKTFEEIATDFETEVPVIFDGIPPDLFKEDSGVVVLGYFLDGMFEAEEIFAKHDENYMPPELSIEAAEI